MRESERTWNIPAWFLCPCKKTRTNYKCAQAPNLKEVLLRNDHSSLQLYVSTTEYNPSSLLCTLWFYCENLHRNWPELCKEARSDESWDFGYNQTCATEFVQRRGVRLLECIIEVQRDRMRDLKIDVVLKVILRFTRRWSWTVKPRKDVWNPDVKSLEHLQKLNYRQIDVQETLNIK